MLDALRFSDVLVPASIGDGPPSVRFLYQAGTGLPVLPVFSDAECYQAWPLSRGHGAVALDFAALGELLQALGATWILVDPDAAGAVAIRVEALDGTTLSDPRQLMTDLFVVGVDSAGMQTAGEFVDRDSQSGTFSA
jgi:hypothetical protein